MGSSIAFERYATGDLLRSYRCGSMFAYARAEANEGCLHETCLCALRYVGLGPFSVIRGSLCSFELCGEAECGLLRAVVVWTIFGLLGTSRGCCTQFCCDKEDEYIGLESPNCRLP